MPIRVMKGISTPVVLTFKKNSSPFNFFLCNCPYLTGSRQLNIVSDSQIFESPPKSRSPIKTRFKNILNRKAMQCACRTERKETAKQCSEPVELSRRVNVLISISLRNSAKELCDPLR